MKTPEDIINRFIKEEGVKFEQERDDWVIEAMIEYAQEQVKNCSIPNVSKSFEIGEKVLHKTTTEVFISDYCEDVEQIEVCCGADYYKVDIDSLVKT